MPLIWKQLLPWITGDDMNPVSINVMWSEKTCAHGVKLIFWVIGIMWKFELLSFQKFLLGSPLILVSKVTECSKAVKNKEKH